jgi:hypothetical protein
VPTALSELRLRRILLALDMAGPAPATLSFAVTLAARFEAELNALLLTQTELTRAADLPFATEVSLLAGMERRLNAPLMRRTLQVVSARVQAMMAELAAPERVRWSLQMAGKTGWEGLLQELGEGSLLVLGHRGNHLPVTRRPRPVQGGVCVVCDEGPSGAAALALAQLLDPQATAIRLAAVAQDAALTAWLMVVRPATLVVPARLMAEHAATVRRLIGRLGCTLVVVG